MIHTITLNPGIDVTLRLERLNLGEVARPSDTAEQAGGKGMNVSVALSELGVDTKAWVFLGGSRGEKWKDLASVYGFTIEPLDLAEETRQNIKIFETDLARQTDLNLPGPAFDQAAFDHLLSGLAREVNRNDFVVVAGSPLPETPNDAWNRLGKVVRANQGRLVIDMSGPALESILECNPWMVKINLDEYNEWKKTSHPDLDSVAAIDGIGERPHHLVLTDGSRGGMGISADGAIEKSSPYPVAVQGTVGAGDAFTAGFLAAWGEREGGWRNALAWGSATAAGAVELPGTNFPSRERVLEILTRGFENEWE